MATNLNSSGEANWGAWAAVAAVVIILIVAVGYWMDWFGGTTTEAVPPAAEQTEPVTE